MFLIHKVAAATGLLPAVRALRACRRARQEQPQARAALQSFLAGLEPHERGGDPRAWRLQRFAPTLGDIAVFMVGPAGQAPAAVVKVARSQAAAQNLRRYRRVLWALARDRRLPEEWRSLLPGVLGAGEAAGRVYLVETVLPGRPLSSAAGPGGMLRAQRGAAATIGQLHRATLEVVSVDGRVRSRLVDGRLMVVRRALAGHPRAERLEAALGRVADELRAPFGGGRLGLSWIHGDFAPDNILAAAGGAPITGVVDWELAAPADLPALDLAQLLVSSRLKARRGELGPLVVDLVSGAGWGAHEAALLDETQAGGPGRPLGARALTLLCWLRHVSDTLCKATGYARNRFWLAANVEYVLSRM